MVPKTKTTLEVWNLKSVIKLIGHGMLIIPALRKLRWEDNKFKASLAIQQDPI
jgi:hypothetical protein